MKKLSDEEKVGRLANALVAFFYKTDAKLDETDLDTFHDKSLVRAEAERYAKDIILALKEL